ncbi:MAG: DUF3090 domain-containing protein [Chloroflexi bacterium]|nr:DUF3090 domain-containing protein [Chloroflexota bacterium]
MPRRIFVFETPDRFVPGTVGEPGDRTFFLQVRKQAAVISVALEKVQVAALAERLGILLDELVRRGIEVPPEPAGAQRDTEPLDEPLMELFRVGTMALSWDGERERVLVETRETTDDEEEALEVADDEDGPDLVRVHLTLEEARAFIERAERIVAAGRLPCPLCGQPLDPRGHLCPRRNGTSYLN